MNLAELRKKSQQAKKEERVLPVSSAFSPDLLVDFPALAEVGAEILEYVEPCPDTDSVPTSAPCERQVEISMDEAAIPKVFDPLAVLLAGRKAAFVDEMAFTDAAEAVAANREEFQEFLCFRVSAEIYAINIMAIKEIIKPREITEVPRAPAFVSGVLSLRGIIIPVFNMRLRLGLPCIEKSVKERIIVLKKLDDFFGILVDEVIQVVKIFSTAIEKPPTILDGIDRDFVNGIGRFDGQMLILLNQDKILDLNLV
jgi:purine-binding chemotaxis protein CheW